MYEATQVAPSSSTRSSRSAHSLRATAEVVHLAGEHQARSAVEQDPPAAYLDHGVPVQLVMVTRAELPRAELGPMITSTSPGSTR